MKGYMNQSFLLHSRAVMLKSDHGASELCCDPRIRRIKSETVRNDNSVLSDERG